MFRRERQLTRRSTVEDLQEAAELEQPLDDRLRAQLQAEALPGVARAPVGPHELSEDRRVDELNAAQVGDHELVRAKQ
jgi:hypothetical protein